MIDRLIDRRALLFGATASAAAMAAPAWASRITRPIAGLKFPDDLAPRPRAPGRAAQLPHADVVVMCDTTAEAAAMAAVMTPGVDAKQWVAYDHNYRSHYLALIGPKGPSHFSHRLGSYYLTDIGGASTLVYKTELHLHTDAKLQRDGSYSLPIKDMLAQIIGEVQPQLFLSTGTAGGVDPAMALGDVVVSRAALFNCKKDFAAAPFNHKAYYSAWTVPRRYIADAQQLMVKQFVAERGHPPSNGCAAPGAHSGSPTVHFDGPIITTDYFEFGTNTNGLDKLGAAVEMDDAVLGLVCSELDSPPHWACVRNLSDPTINGKLSVVLQRRCAEYYYQKFGYDTSINSALAAWAIVAGIKEHQP